MATGAESIKPMTSLTDGIREVEQASSETALNLTKQFRTRQPRCLGMRMYHLPKPTQAIILYMEVKGAFYTRSSKSTMTGWNAPVPGVKFLRPSGLRARDPAG